MYSLENLILVLFVIEIFVISLFLIAVPLNRLYLFLKNRYIVSSKEKISKIIMDCLQKKEPFSIHLGLEKFKGQKVLLLVLEEFNKKFDWDDWIKLRDSITKNYLLPKARKLANSWFWINRNFAARTFVLTPLQHDKKIILKLVNDPVFLVRSIAAIAAAHLNDKECIREIIQKKSQAKGYAHFFYRDILLTTSQQGFVWITELAEEEKDPSFHLGCLQLLFNKSIIAIPNYLKNDIQSPNSEIRLAAVKILVNNPQADTSHLLAELLKDPVPEIRSEAASGLQYFPNPEIFMKLEESLNDPVWIVRLNVALTLKKMGPKGLEILRNQSKQKSNNGYEVSQAVINFNW